ncbi:MAG TPA: MarC family protein [Dehalococcoidia bacterium]|nr:MarC family protein [Dehalococcoidia bacterium]
MAGFWDSLLVSFVPLFVAIDAVGTLPAVIRLSEGMGRRERARLVNLAIFTAAAVGLVFLFLGRPILRLLAISVGHFAVAGGLLLLAFSVRDLVIGKMVDEPSKEEMVAVVPIGTPLTVGPATLTTLFLLSDQHSLPIVLLAFAVNMAAAWLIFLQASAISSFLGRGGLRAVSKVASLLLAAIGVRMVFRGIELVLG